MIVLLVEVDVLVEVQVELEVLVESELLAMLPSLSLFSVSFTFFAPIELTPRANIWLGNRRVVRRKASKAHVLPNGPLQRFAESQLTRVLTLPALCSISTHPSLSC